MSSLLKPLRFRFTDPQDIADYGERWWLYDESVIIGHRARTLMALEQEIGVPTADVFAGVRASSAFGDLAGSWLAMKLDPDFGDKIPDFEDYNPIVMKIEWRVVPAEDLEPGKEEPSAGESVALEPGGSKDQPASAPSVLPPSESLLLPVASDSGATSPMDTVSLVTMPVTA